MNSTKRPFDWVPTPEIVANSNLTAFIRKTGEADLAALSRRADADPAWLMQPVFEYCDFRVYTPPQQMLDTSRGIEWARWCVGGTTNVVLNCIDRHRGTPVWEQTFLVWEGEDPKNRRSLSYREFDAEVCRLASALQSLGIGRGDRVGLYLPNLPETFIAFFAVLKIGAVLMPLFSGFGPQPLISRLNDGEAKAVLTVDGTWRRGSPGAMKSVLDEALAEVPSVQHVLVLRHLGQALACPMTPGRDHDWATQVAAQPHDIPTAEMEADAPAVLLYTSGTTGKPKGAMHSHHGLVYTVRGYNTLIARSEADECMCFLPLCHIAERMGGEYFSLYTGAKLNFVENPETVPENVREIAPTVFTAVPRVWEKFYSGVMIALKEAGALQQAAYAWAIGVGQRVADLVMAQQPVPGPLKLQFHLARVLVLNNVRKLIGIHKARFLVTGAAPISPELVRWYMALGVPMLEVWGMTETCGASTGVPAERIKPGSIGPAASYNDVRLDPQTGEILVRGPNVFMGYLNQPEKTAETIDKDGWLHTGDVGVIDEEGFFRITDRMKDIIITA
ncbi:MAG: AMP-binding protein, partial [Hydrogenophaga sp.]|nr:AMP-binding protein [Hydrogenophaga sp.]